MVQRDDAGHRASDAAVDELDGRGLVRADGREIVFTTAGEEALQDIVAAIRNARNT